MAHVKKGHLVAAPEWWKHLRKIKRLFWKRHRKAEKREAAKQTGAGGVTTEIPPAAEPGSLRR